MTQHAEENLRAAETREARRAAERKAEMKARKESKRVEDTKDDGDIKGHSEDVGAREEQQKRGAATKEERKKGAATKEEKKKRKAKTPKTPGLIQVLEMQSRVAGFEVR